MENQENALTIAPAELTFEEVRISCPIENGHRMIPVKTICTILDVQFKNQDSWLKEHPVFSQLYLLEGVVAADNKVRSMNCLPIFDLYAWVASISLNKREPESVRRQHRFMAWLREKMIDTYKSIDVWIQENKYEQQLLELKDQTEEQLLNAKKVVKELKGRMDEIHNTIEDIRAKRFSGQTALQFPE
jgi:hypothetical protein